MPMRVESVAVADVADGMSALANTCLREGRAPSYVLAILNGGAIPAQEFIRALRSNGHTPLLISYRLQRSTTSRLKNVTVKLISRACPVILDPLRKFEASLRTGMPYKPRDNRPPMANDALVRLLSHTVDSRLVAAERPVAVVDDAIDSGRTMAIVLESLKRVGVDRSSTLVVTYAQTTEEPLVSPDLCMRFQVLCRFPWSSDSQYAGE